MAMDDRDGNRYAQQERDKQRQMDATRAKFAAFSRTQGEAKPMSPTRTGLIPMLIFWCGVMGLLYLLMTHYLQPRPAQVLANGDLVIDRAQDGHFYTMGRINGQEAQFMVDTGASLVSVSEAFARKASIHGGVPTTFKTANGDRPGWVVEGVGVSIGPVSVSHVKVGVGLSGGDENAVLLGQSFLSRFDITISKNQLVLRAR